MPPSPARRRDARPRRLLDGSSARTLLVLAASTGAVALGAWFGPIRASRATVAGALARRRAARARHFLTESRSPGEDLGREDTAMRRGDWVGGLGWRVLALALLLVVPVAAQDVVIRLDGRVQWIAGEKMMLIPDDGEPPVEVDIKQVPLDQYRTLTENDPVTVRGVVAPSGRKLIARSVRPAGR